MPNILIVGAGQLGSRHLQGAVQSELALNIVVVDPSSDSLAVAKSRAEEIELGNPKTAVEYINAVSQGSEFDVVIIATTANIRYRVFKDLVDACQIKNVVFEKVLFQKAAEYELAESLLRENNIKAWVNCPRRQNATYQSLLSLVENETSFDMTVSGNSWGLACNGIHFVDLFAYLSGTTEITLFPKLCDKSVMESKRSGFYEVLGTIECKSSNDKNMILSCDDGDSISVNVEIRTPNFTILIQETAGKLTIERNGERVETQFKAVFQSQLTHVLIEDIIKTQSCKLTTFSDSKSLHVPFINTIKTHLENSLNKQFEACPIT
ncbi:Gfo/Idh/MocA family oxidoreductase [Catenovulum maritimum]|uniref:Gfo/Idh/MocA-like oxidoreductase N-terminal domain-containing protein n=1 Tax=Catenovulum maritimum TaxID=1513271 RepID=A0A0J8GTU7_9ALTE|nr:Gfo/Idh/MocA family oxidoreductase [Catenovulum maritimum]KMT64739.1 hypothetical protein XM47_12835 [Catenovulum maritimum]